MWSRKANEAAVNGKAHTFTHVVHRKDRESITQWVSIQHNHKV